MNIGFHPSTTPLRRAGFSLVEMLMVIAILGIMSSMVIIAFGGVREGAENEKDKRNAQNIASLAAVASAADADFAVPGDKTASVENLRDGCSPSSGIFKGHVYQLPSMTSHDIQGAIRYLHLKGSELVYHQVSE
ncbi:prepilin-type N-terminal cleavage/methylation domain-containing protein [Prosthecobacter dejongeii]|uniref:Prepilin-type N-terminal cleavage/methylation domain-containing protein n=1 Tax=Prosthecobacter dejongeii TaxID=48465 RepID=A0A7W8DSW0_9BACT|nr:prepilin-type N-terminal cleavage/methylation domain-containing protein [Prosthecobacter dejongeii]